MGLPLYVAFSILIASFKNKAENTRGFYDCINNMLVVFNKFLEFLEVFFLPWHLHITYAVIGF